MKRNNLNEATANIYELVSHFDLNSLNELPKLLNWKTRKIEDLQATLWERIYSAQYSGMPSRSDAADIFRFLASASIRGDVCPGCRSEKLESLGRFAALYSDETIVPLPLVRPEREQSPARTRLDLFNTLETLLRLRPLIEAGIAKPAVMSTAAHCKHEVAQTRELIDIASLFANELADIHVDQFEMLYEPSDGTKDRPKLYVRGPEQYIEHGELVIRLPETPEWAAKSWRRGNDGFIRVPKRTARKIGVVHSLFQRIASDTTFHLAYGIPRRAKLLTDLPGDAELLKGIDQEELEIQSRRAILLNALAHALPFVDELPLSEIVRIRKCLNGAFEQYRYAITSIVRSHESDRNISPRLAKQIFRDELFPRIVTLENQIDLERSRRRSKATAAAGIMSIVVGLGIFGVITPSVAISLLGGAATMKIADQIGDNASPSQSKTNDLFFLLKLKERAHSRSK